MKRTFIGCLVLLFFLTGCSWFQTKEEKPAQELASDGMEAFKKGKYDKAIGPVIEELAGTFGNKIKFAKCNVDDNPATPGKYGIKAIPTLIFFKEGNVVDQITGMVAKSKLEESINKIL